MRSLLHDYLATDGTNALYTQRDSVNLSINIFNKNPRDKQKVRAVYLEASLLVLTMVSESSS